MRDRLYSDWKLEHLRAEGCRALSHDASATWEAAMRHALPNLKTIRILRLFDASHIVLVSYLAIISYAEVTTIIFRQIKNGTVKC